MEMSNRMDLKRELTEKQKVIKEVLDKLEEYFSDKNGLLCQYDITLWVREAKKEYDIVSEYPTLREYLEETKNKNIIYVADLQNKIGTIKFFGLSDFEDIYSEKILDCIVLEEEKGMNLLGDKAIMLTLKKADDTK